MAWVQITLTGNDIFCVFKMSARPCWPSLRALRQAFLTLISHRMRVCATSASDVSITPSSMRLVCSARFSTFQWCRSNRSVPERRRRSFLGLRCQLMIKPPLCLQALVPPWRGGLVPSGAKSISHVSRTLRKGCHRPLEATRTTVSTNAATENKFLCTGATVVFANVSPMTTAFLCDLASFFGPGSRSKSRLLELQSQLRMLLCAREGSMRSLGHRDHTATDLQWFFQSQAQVAVHPIVACSKSSELYQLHLQQQLRCFCSLSRAVTRFSTPLLPLSVPLRLPFWAFPLPAVFLPLLDPQSFIRGPGFPQW